MPGAQLQAARFSWRFLTFAVTLHARNQLVRRQAVEVEVGQRQAVWVGVGVIGHGGYRQDSRVPIEAQKRTAHASYIV